VAVPEAVLQVDESSESCWSSLIDLTGFTAVAVGPGLGTDGETAFALRTLLKALLERETAGTPLSLILDADALNLLATDYQLLSLVPPHSLLTPHLGEMRRLCRALDLPCEELADLQVAARMLSDSLRLNLLLKDHIPHLFIPEGRLLVAEGGGNSALAKAGSGDVLTGLIGGLAAQGYLPEEAAGLGVCLHREAGKIAEARHSAPATVASDLVDAVGQAFLHLLPPH
jgi:putative yjeF-related sugar kinase